MGSRLVNGAILTLAVVLAGLFGVLAYQTLAGADSTPLAQSVGGPFTLVDGAGKTVTDRDFRGRWMLVYFGYTHCPDACPTALNDVAVALDRLEVGRRAKVRPVFVTVDPERDTPDVMRDYVAAFGPNFVGLTGTPEQIRAVEHQYKVYAAKHPEPDGSYDMDHSSYIYVMDPEGRFVTTFTHETSPDEMAETLGKKVR
jgi:protein SCO1/2